MIQPDLTPQKYLKNPITFTAIKERDPIRFVDNSQLKNPITIYPQEEFKMIDFYGIKPNMYYISSYGRVFGTHTGKELRPVHDEDYMKIGLRLEKGNKRGFRVHRLVANAFIPKTEEDIELNRDIVNHKNLNGIDNHIWNLEWCTEDENKHHAKENKAFQLKRLKKELNILKEKDDNSERKILRGSDHGISKITDEQAHMICKCLEKGYSNGECCIEVGLEPNRQNKVLVSHIASGDCWEQISKNYDIPKYRCQSRFAEFIIPVCELLECGERIVDIIRKLNIPGDKDCAKGFVSGIKNRKNYKKISKDYNF